MADGLGCLTEQSCGQKDKPSPPPGCELLLLKKSEETHSVYTQEIELLALLTLSSHTPTGSERVSDMSTLCTCLQKQMLRRVKQQELVKHCFLSNVKHYLLWSKHHG